MKWNEISFKGSAKVENDLRENKRFILKRASKALSYSDFGHEKRPKSLPVYWKCSLPMKAITVKEIKLNYTPRRVFFLPSACWWNNYWITKGDFSWIMKERAQKYPNFFMYSSYNGIDLFHWIASWRLEKEFFYRFSLKKFCLIIKSNQKYPRQRSAVW